MDRLLDRPETLEWQLAWGREPVKTSLRAALAEARRSLSDVEASPPDVESLLLEARKHLERLGRPSLRRVLNGTGVVLHTNLGRAPLATEARQALDLVAGYSNLEYDLDTGGRGSRYDHCTALLCELTQAEAAVVVNNNAAAVALAVNELALGREVVVSRGELVEIGGSFRIPDVVERSGARLVEVGTTNRTRREDYETALGPETGAILKVHPSNYRIEGFASAVTIHDLVDLGRANGIPVVHDLGSGLLEPGLLPGFPEEPGVGASVAAGVDLVTWSGDKLLGGPQAGVLMGARSMVERLRRNPLLRAFRVDKMTLISLEATLTLYRDPDLAATRVPALRMLREPQASVERRARAALGELDEGTATIAVGSMSSLVGGGAYPGHEIASAGWIVRGPSPEAVEIGCRAGSPPLLGRVAEDAFLIDFRTLLPEDEGDAARVLSRVLGGL
jgi:L-seryl-tRNA(Ser) seleniumtransferase